MARPRTVPDSTVHDSVLALIRVGGEKAVTFSAVAERVGLAPSSLAERHGSVQGMIQDARAGIWLRLEQGTELIVTHAPPDAKGATRMLKQLAPLVIDVPLRADPARAAQWRQRVEAGLALRLGGGAGAREKAGIMFTFWLGQITWGLEAGKPARLKDLLRHLG